MLAATVRVTRDLDLAEESVQEAYAEAISAWAQAGVPRSPGAWLTTVARRKALDVVRRAAHLQRLLPELVVDQVVQGVDVRTGWEIPDDRLRLIFTCCHPALAPEARAALTLRLLCGLTTAEVARAFLVSEPTMAARITRAKKKIAVARIPYRVPATQDLPERVDSVVEVVRLVHTTGHTAPAGTTLMRLDLTDRALELARLLRALLPQDPTVAALLALLLFQQSRSATREQAGELVLLADQDRQRWDHTMVADGAELVREALLARPASDLALEAAIAAVHAQSPSWEDTDWSEIVVFYSILLRRTGSPVVALNRAVALGFADGFEVGLAALDELAADPRLSAYSYLASSRADFLRRLGRVEPARAAYAHALRLTENSVERAFLERRLAELSPLA